MRISKTVYFIGSLVLTVLVVAVVNRVLNARRMKSLASGNANVRALLMAIRHAEGTAGPDGYRTQYGGGLFDNYGQHPRNAFYTPWGWTSAAGAYQIMAKVSGKVATDTWDNVQAALNLPDFSPASQDAAAVELIRRRGGLDHAIAGRFPEAINAIRKEWASLPGAGYGQGEKSIAQLTNWYTAAGGQLA